MIAIGLGISIWVFNFKTQDEAAVGSAIGPPMMSIGFSYIVISTPLLRLHLDLMSHHVTEKEFNARMKTCQKLKVDDDLLGNLTLGQKI